MLQILRHQLLSKYSTFGIGGPASYFAVVSSIQELQEAFAFARKTGLSIHLLGKGSNSLFSDKGFDGLVLLCKIDHSSIEGTEVRAGAGKSFAHLGIQTAKEGLSGLEFAAGIPAAVGGAIVMNAGAGGHELASVIKSVTFLSFSGELRVFTRDELDFSYRTSPFQQMRGAIVEATFSLFREKEAKERQKSLLSYRMSTQPYSEKSCGCIFRNPAGRSAGALIDACGLKGRTEGGAAVSELHANFIVNRGGATAEEVLSLARKVQECVKEQTGVELELELRIVPETYASLSR